jgi:hypothetical protein
MFLPRDRNQRHQHVVMGNWERQRIKKLHSAKGRLPTSTPACDASHLEANSHLAHRVVLAPLAYGRLWSQQERSFLGPPASGCVRVGEGGMGLRCATERARRDAPGPHTAANQLSAVGALANSASRSANSPAKPPAMPERIEAVLIPGDRQPERTLSFLRGLLPTRKPSAHRARVMRLVRWR